MNKRFVVLDRDGTIIVEKHYLADPGRVELLPGAAEGLRRLSAAGFGLIIVTNQSGIGRGYFSHEQLELVNNKMLSLLAARRVSIDGLFYCPHTPEDDCDCRKPRPGLILAAGQQHCFLPRESYVIGDKPCDILLGRNIQATTLLVRTGYGAQTAADRHPRPDFIVDNLREAAAVIIPRAKPAPLPPF